MSFLTFVLPLTALLQPVLAATAYTSSNNETPKDNNADCNCYVVESGADSKSPSYFQYYRFYDFRNLEGALTSTPTQINDSDDAGLLPTWQSDIFDGDAWNQDWSIQNWTTPSSEDFPIPMNNSLANVWIGKEDDASYLSLRTSRDSEYQTSGEIENNQKNLMHVSMRMYGRVVGSKGAVAGFFTFFDDDNESDIEILTDDPKSTIRYTNQPSVDDQGNEVQAASVKAASLAPWNEWQTHRIDWLPENSYWYLNQKQVAANSYSVPKEQSNLVLNMWSNGGEWSGNMTVGESAEFHIQWIEMAFNTSGPYAGQASQDKREIQREVKRESSGCKTVCKIDGVKQVGTPEVAKNSGAAGMGVSWELFIVVGLVSMLTAF